jgi:Domain of unknown function (DUF4291)
LLSQAVESSWDPERIATREDWEQGVSRSSVRLQWDPDHSPSGGKLERRAIQLGLRDEVLEAFGRRELVEVIDLTDFVAEQRAVLTTQGIGALVTPMERVYTPANPEIAARLGLASVT